MAVEDNDTALPDSTDTLVISESMEMDQDQEELEEILSDEDLMFEEYAEMDLDMAEFGEDIGKSFNPYGIELQSLQSLPNPAMTSLQRTVKNLNAQLFSDRKEIEEAGSRLQGSLQLTCRGEKWIEGMGHVAVILPNALAYLQSVLDMDQLESIHNKIIEWVLDGLDFERARQQVPSTHTVRQIKCGLNLSLAIGNLFMHIQSLDLLRIILMLIDKTVKLNWIESIVGMHVIVALSKLSMQSSYANIYKVSANTTTQNCVSAPDFLL